MNKQLTDAQLHQLDIINNAAYNAVKEALKNLGTTPPWDMEWIGEVSDCIADVAQRYFNVPEVQVYPFIDDENITLTPVTKGAIMDGTGDKMPTQVAAMICVTGNPHADLWGQDTEHTRSDWKFAVTNDDTNLGYWEWVEMQKEEDNDN